jgi:hypothetical protein
LVEFLSLALAQMAFGTADSGRFFFLIPNNICNLHS